MPCVRLFIFIELFHSFLLSILKFFNYCREMQERLRDLSEDENNDK